VVSMGNAGGLHHHKESCLDKESSPIIRFLIIILLFAQTNFIYLSHPGYFGKLGMRHFHNVGKRHYCPTITIELSNFGTLIPDDSERLPGQRKRGCPSSLM